MDRNFGGVIWTNHALQRLRERGIKQSDAWVCWRSPDQSRTASAKGAWVYYKTFGNERIEVVASQNERKEWVILSVWSRPLYGQDTRVYKKGAGVLERVLQFTLGWLKR
ncbi:MAG: DUF4258 domain-containing protein [Candidatus Blackburnbacteria bacterium]|nr:DUF4258 domain-containing protein [Candidatus Blackburnbacteria bacterium]